ncbi:putative transcriptional regulator, MerR family [Nocardia nova SH22a]|uniref:Putative transcriptional regulator, MerR family n=1 Tax=Nocardia nova SH22a TaxID=1415166 RepID=W5TR67_9NOCA|nr:MerR family transcriptional regulator [Nocardia nova]AHH21762.1 putative transcriptional regulator, MerR family [Nocardia nova SH22a]
MLIGEVSRRSGVSTRMLRHYDRLGLVRPTGRTTGGYREYSTDDIRRLFHVESLRTLGLSLADTKRALDDADFAPGALVGDLIRHTRARIAAETELLAKLERVESAAPAQWEDVLNVITLLRALESNLGDHRQQAALAQYEGAALPVDALVEAALAEEDPNVAGALRWALARAGDAGLANLAAGLRSPDPDRRHRATVTIAEVPGTQATALLIEALNDSAVIVRDRAALALGARQVIDAVPALLEMIVTGRTDVEAAELLGLLAETPDADMIRNLRHELDIRTDPAARLRLTQALAEIPGTTAQLTALTEDSDPVIAGTAAAILRTRERRNRRSGPQ